MTCLVRTHVQCNHTDEDGSECLAVSVGVTGPAVNRPAARAKAAKVGWTHQAGYDYCPRHNPNPTT